MSRTEAANLRLALHLPLRWLVNLRWLAGGAVIVGGLANALWLRWYPYPWALVGCGAVILAYNALLRRLLRAPGRRRVGIVTQAWIHILTDLLLLSLLVMCTGAAESPLLGFFVFHMVFASLLLSPRAAYACAAAAIVLMAATAALHEGTPPTRSDWLRLIGWAVTLLLTVYLTGYITARLRRHRQQLVARNRRVRGLVDRLRQQQMAMIQHEKAVTMGHMAAGVAHEIANPLASMDSLLQLMKRNEKHLTTEKVDTLRHQIDRIKITVRHMTDFAHPTEFQWRMVPINDLVDSGLELVRFDHRLRQVKLEKHYTPRNCKVRVQAHAVQQVLVNVMLNAMDALADRPDARITVRTLCEGRGPTVQIADNGPGVGPAVRSELFEPFFTTKPVGKGTGLGLTICAQLMRRQGGDIELVDNDGGGATFRITLPAFHDSD